MHSYKPVCNPVCMNQGVCVNDNVCECTETYTGSICSERNKHERNKIFDIIINTLSVLFILVTIITMYLIFYFRNYEVIKSGNFFKYNNYYCYYYTFN